MKSSNDHNSKSCVEKGDIENHISLYSNRYKSPNNSSDLNTTNDDTDALYSNKVLLIRDPTSHDDDDDRIKRKKLLYKKS